MTYSIHYSFFDSINRQFGMCWYVRLLPFSPYPDLIIDTAHNKTRSLINKFTLSEIGCGSAISNSENKFPDLLLRPPFTIFAQDIKNRIHHQ